MLVLNNQKEIRYDPIQIKRSLKRKIDTLAFNNQLEKRLIASALLELIMNDPEKVEEVCKKLKMAKE